MSVPASDLDKNKGIQRTRELTAQHGENGWDLLWQEGTTPWDHGSIKTALTEALKIPQLNLPESGNALVPGCGRGYDAIYIAASLGYRTVGLDLSATAVNAANELLFRLNAGRVTTSFRMANFFDFDPEDGTRYDIIYDYTFFCAITPAMRDSWGLQMTKLTRPGGYLITLCYPIDGDREGGPPYSVDVDAYARALGSQWQKVVDKIPENAPDPIGRERLVVWQRDPFSS